MPVAEPTSPERPQHSQARLLSPSPHVHPSHGVSLHTQPSDQQLLCWVATSLGSWQRPEAPMFPACPSFAIHQPKEGWLKSCSLPSATSGPPVGMRTRQPAGYLWAMFWVKGRWGWVCCMSQVVKQFPGVSEKSLARRCLPSGLDWFGELAPAMTTQAALPQGWWSSPGAGLLAC